MGPKICRACWVERCRLWVYHDTDTAFAYCFLALLMFQSTYLFASHLGPGVLHVSNAHTPAHNEDISRAKSTPLNSTLAMEYEGGCGFMH
jgi:hypothetical protein